VTSPPTVADLIRHYVRHHGTDRTQHAIAADLRAAAGTGSASALSAWLTGVRAPASAKPVRELRKLVGCHCPEFGNEAINHAWQTIMPGTQTSSGRARPNPRANAKAEIALPQQVPTRWASQPFIVGRDNEVRDFVHLRAGRIRHRVTNIYGPGGIGKTALFRKFLAVTAPPAALMGYADVAELRYADAGQPYGFAEILRALATPAIGQAEFAQFHQELEDFDVANVVVANAGGVTAMYAPGGTVAATPGVSARLRTALRDRFAFERYLRQASQNLTRSFCEALDAIAETSGGTCCLLLDTYEEMGWLDDWMCRELVPMLPDGSRVVLLGRYQLTKTNIDWLDHQDILRDIALPELAEDEAKSYLQHYGLSGTQALQGVYEVTGGYPLLLFLARALAHESGGWAVLGELKQDRDRDRIARGLLDRILREERVRVIRDVLESCSLAPWINPETIKVLLGVSDSEARRLYDELDTHSFATRHPRGLVLHDKIRELLQARLRFAGESRYAELTERLAGYLASKAGAGRG
jgi:hypothetical protein